MDLFKNPLNWLTILYRSILDFLYPPICYICDSRLKESERLICRQCWSGFSSYKGGIKIERKNLSVPGRKSFSECFALYTYSDKTLKLIHTFKYSKKKSLAKEIGKDLRHLLINNGFNSSFDYMLPIPLHKSKERERGFNQSDLLCRSASEESGLPFFSDIAVRIKNNKPQSHLSYRERIENVKNIFRIKTPDKVINKNIIVIDDIITTGLTVNSLCDELKKSGAKNIICICVIHPA